MSQSTSSDPTIVATHADALALTPQDAVSNDERRIVMIPNSVNLRDIGGYKTADGRRTRWAQIYRSGQLDMLEPHGVAAMQALNVQRVYDLRSADEAEKMPDLLPGGVARVHRPIIDPRRLGRLRTVWHLFLQRWRKRNLLLESYVEIVMEKNAVVIGEIITAAAQDEARPLLIHCTAGKDRTGIVVALLLATLGVPDERIVADYALSNVYHAHFVRQMQDNVEIMKRFGLSEALIVPLLLADPTTMQSFLDTVRVRYGSVEQYLIQRGRVAPATFDKLRAQLLV